MTRRKSNGGRQQKKRYQNQQQQQQRAGESSDDGGYLTIGGIRIHTNTDGIITRTTTTTRGGSGHHLNRTPTPTPAPGNSSMPPPNLSSPPLEVGEMDSEDMLDYLENVGGGGGDGGDESRSDGDDDGSGVSLSSLRRFEMLRRFSAVELGDEGAPEDIIGRFEYEINDSSDGDDDDDDDDDDGGSSASSFSSEEEGVEREGRAAEMEIINDDDDGDEVDALVLTLEELDQLDPSLRYPVVVRPTHPLSEEELQQYHQFPVGNGNTSGSKKNRKKNGKNGKLPPGEKARLRRERIEAKRATRAVGQGFDLVAINKTLQQFVETEEDMIAFPPLGKREVAKIVKLAALYGCKAGAQGSGKTRSVMVVCTERTEMPKGTALLEIGRMLTAQTAAELGYPPHLAKKTASPSSTTTNGRGNGGERCGDVRRKGQNKHISNNNSNARNQNNKNYSSFFPPPPSRTSRHTKKLPKPIHFVSKGVINPDDDDEVFQVVVQHHHSAAAAAVGDEEDVIVIDDDEVDVIVIDDDDDDMEEEDDDDDDDGPAMPSVILEVFEDREGDGGSNSVRVLGLGGLTVDIGSEILGAPGVEDHAAASAASALAADLSPLQPCLSKSAQKKALRRKQGGGSASFSSQAPPPLTAFSILPSYPPPPPPAAAGGGGVGKQRKGKRGTGNNNTNINSSGPQTNVGGDFADFEQHTTGIGSKLLMKWGFQGQGSGLGRDGSGIAEPLEAKMRGKRVGLGADRC